MLRSISTMLAIRSVSAALVPLLISACATQAESTPVSCQERAVTLGDPELVCRVEGLTGTRFEKCICQTQEIWDQES